MFFNGTFFSVNIVPQYLTFKIYYAIFLVKLSTNKYSTLYNEQFGGDLFKISQILII